MTALYELSGELMETLADIQSRLEDGEEVAESEIEQALQLNQDFENKALNIAKFVKNLQSDAEQLAVENKKRQAKQRAIENLADKLKGYLLDEMQATGKTKIGDRVFSVKVQANSVYSIAVENPTALPAEYQVIKVEADKKALLEAFKKAECNENFMHGVAINKGSHLRLG